MKKKNVAILGAGSYGEVFLTYLTEANYNIVGFFDDNPNDKNRIINGVKVLGDFKDLITSKFRKKIDQIFCPIGNNEIRTLYLSTLRKNGYETPNFIHSSVILNKDVVIGYGVYMLPGVIIMPHTKIEDYVIISMGSRIAHHTILKEGVFVSTGVNVGANIVIESKAFLGISSTIMTGVQSIGENSIIGCGAVVIKDVSDNIVVAGVPAKKIKDREIDKNYNYGYQTIKIAENQTNKSLDIITQKKDWDDVLKEIGDYDFYHTYDYHMLSKAENETPILLKYVENNIIIALPLLIRKIENTNYKDATSVYGYAGPISKNLSFGFDNNQFQEKIKKYFETNNFVSVFSRLNPFIPEQCRALINLGSLTKQGKVVNIDLKQDIDIQRQNFQNRLKTHINKARRCCTIKRASSEEGLQKFMDIYYENMDRVHAKKSYYFTIDYFQKMVSSQDFKSEVLLAIDNESGETIAASQFVMTNNIVQYHLSGTKNDFLHLTPTKLLIDEMRLIASEKGFTYFNLGGGLGGKDDDSLFNFKASFSKDFKDFFLWKFICNQEVYDKLILKKGVDTDSNFFPLYRSLDDINVTL